MSELTTTSYAILGLLSLRPWSAYELSKQMKRWALIWPRAERAVYNEPKKLVEQGLATAKVELNGKQQRTVYTISPAGRRALKRWLAQPSAPPQFESEALVRALFAPSGSKDDLLAAIGSLADYAQALRDKAREAGGEYLDGPVRFPERLHIIGLVVQFNVEFVALLERWAAWAEEEVSGWANTTDPGVFPTAREVISRALLEGESPAGVGRPSPMPSSGAGSKAAKRNGGASERGRGSRRGVRD